MGHGNGWPSPYTYDPIYTTKDGFGLNATAGDGDYNNKYYGEPYVATLDLAPGAIVLLHHLCYASGNSEPGDAEPSVVGRPPARRQLRRRASSRPAHRRSSPTATPAPSATCGRCSRPTSRSRTCGARMPNAERQRRVVRRRRGRRARRSTRTPTRRPPGSTARSRSAPSASRPTRSSSAGYGDTGADPTTCRARQRRGRDRRRRPVRRPRTRRSTTGRDRCPPGPACASSTSRPGRPPRATAAGRGRGHRRPVDHRLHARHRPRAARQHARRSSASLDAGRAVLAERRRPGRHGHDPRPLHRIGRLDAARPQRRRRRSCSRRPARGATFERLGRHGRRRPGRRTARTPSSVTGDDAWDNAPATRHAHARRRHRGRRRSTGLTPGADTTPVVLAERRRRPRHGQP